MMKSWQFPVPTLEDKAPKNIAETVAQTVGVAKATSPWLSVFVLGHSGRSLYRIWRLSVHDRHLRRGRKDGYRPDEIGQRGGLQRRPDARRDRRCRALHRQQPDGFKRHVEGDYLRDDDEAMGTRFHRQFYRLSSHHAAFLSIPDCGRPATELWELLRSRLPIAKSTSRSAKLSGAESAATGSSAWQSGWPSPPVRRSEKFSPSFSPSWPLSRSDLSTASPICISFPPAYCLCRNWRCRQSRGIDRNASTGSISCGRTSCRSPSATSSAERVFVGMSYWGAYLRPVKAPKSSDHLIVAIGIGIGFVFSIQIRRPIATVIPIATSIPNPARK